MDKIEFRHGSTCGKVQLVCTHPDDVRISRGLEELDAIGLVGHSTPDRRGNIGTGRVSRAKGGRCVSHHAQDPGNCRSVILRSWQVRGIVSRSHKPVRRFRGSGQWLLTAQPRYCLAFSNCLS